MANVASAILTAEAERANLRDFIMAAPAVLCILTGPEHVCEIANANYLKTIGGRDVIGKPIRVALPELKGQGFYELLDAVYASGEPFIGNEVPVQLDRGSGRMERGYFNFCYQPRRNANGNVIGIAVYAHEVTAFIHSRQTLAEALERERQLRVVTEESESKFRSLFDAMPQLGWIAQPDGFIDFYNRGWYEYTGTTLQQMKGWGWRSVHDPSLLAAVESQWRQSIERGIPFEMSFPLRRHDGVFRWFLTRASPHKDSSGQVLHWVGINTDIDDLRTSEQRLAETLAREQRARAEAELMAGVGTALTGSTAIEDQLRACAQSVVDVLKAAFVRIWVVDDSGEVLLLRASAGMYTHLDGGHARVPVGALKIGRIASEKTPHLTNAVLNDPAVSDHAWAAREGMIAFAGYPLLIDGRLVGVLALFSRQELSSDTLATLASIADQIALGITRARSAHQVDLARAEVEIARQRLQSIFALAPIGITILRGPAYIIEMANPPVCRIWGRSLAELINRGLFEALPEISGQGLEALLDGVRTTGVPFVGTEVSIKLARTPGGKPEEAFFTFVYEPMRNARGEVESVLVVASDVTDGVNTRRQVERDRDAQVRAEVLARSESEKNRDFERQLVGIVSHDLRNPLYAISLGAQSLLRANGLDGKSKTVIERILSSTDRATRLIHDLLDFTKARLGGGIRVEPRAMNLSALARTLAEELRAAHPEREIRCHTEGEIQGAFDSDRLAQVITNLVSNALKYGARDKPVVITTRAGVGLAILEVHNEGAPIPADVLPRIFQPLQRFAASDEASARSVGLGLYIVQQLVEAHGGRVEVISSGDRGTTFKVSLPCKLPA